MKFSYLIFLLFLFSNTYSQSTWNVTRVVDGDTFYASLDGNELKFRFIGIDTPEFSHFGRPEETYAAEATAFLYDLINGKEVVIEYDVQAKDRYNRHLVYVYLKDGTFLNADIMQKGWAQLMTIPPNVKHVDLFKALQKKARKQEIGIWKI